MTRRVLIEIEGIRHAQGPRKALQLAYNTAPKKPSRPHATCDPKCGACKDPSTMTCVLWRPLSREGKAVRHLTTSLVVHPDATTSQHNSEYPSSWIRSRRTYHLHFLATPIRSSELLLKPTNPQESGQRGEDHRKARVGPILSRSTQDCTFSPPRTSPHTGERPVLRCVGPSSPCGLAQLRLNARADWHATDGIFPRGLWAC